jgi:hypothetical protein
VHLFHVKFYHRQFSERRVYYQYHWDGKKDEIYKFSKNGHILAILEHPKLKEARYVSKDMFGNIYVCSMLKSSIIPNFRQTI